MLIPLRFKIYTQHLLKKKGRCMYCILVLATSCSVHRHVKNYPSIESSITIPLPPSSLSPAVERHFLAADLRPSQHHPNMAIAVVVQCDRGHQIWYIAALAWKSKARKHDTFISCIVCGDELHRYGIAKNARQEKIKQVLIAHEKICVASLAPTYSMFCAYICRGYRRARVDMHW
jgi:hypothetical protein